MKTLISCLRRVPFIKFIGIAGLFATLLPPAARAQGPEGKSFGFGILLGDPLAVTVKLWTAYDQAFVGDIGRSDFGPLRLEGDYDWHFNVFPTNIVKMYAGPGLALAIGTSENRFFEDEVRDQTHLGVGVRVMFGLNVIPRRTPLEIFLEVGPLIEFVPNVDAGVDFGVGLRFYP